MKKLFLFIAILMSFNVLAQSADSITVLNNKIIKLNNDINLIRKNSQLSGGYLNKAANSMIISVSTSLAAVGCFALANNYNWVKGDGRKNILYGASGVLGAISIFYIIRLPICLHKSGIFLRKIK